MAYWVTRRDAFNNNLGRGVYKEIQEFLGPFNDYHQADVAAQPYRQQQAEREGKPVSSWRSFSVLYFVLSDEELATARALGTRIT